MAAVEDRADQIIALFQPPAMSAVGRFPPFGINEWAVRPRMTKSDPEPSFACRRTLPTANPKAAIARNAGVVSRQPTAARRLPPSRAPPQSRLVRLIRGATTRVRKTSGCDTDETRQGRCRLVRGNRRKFALKGNISAGSRAPFGSTPRRSVRPRRFDDLTILEGIAGKGVNPSYSPPHACYRCQPFARSTRPSCCDRKSTQRCYLLTEYRRPRCLSIAGEICRRNAWRASVNPPGP